MKRILVIGSPGSGKSRLSKDLSLLLGLPILHLDYIYHIDNERQISRADLKDKITQFVLSNDSFIIDGNYNGTLEYRLAYADTVFFYMIDKEICMENAVRRLQEPKRDDMAPGFDHTKMDDDFLDYIRDFECNNISMIEHVLKKFPNVNVIRFKSYKQKDEFLENLR